MKFSELRAAMDILAPYYDNPDGYHVGAEHDMIYLYATDQELPSELVAQLVSMNWWQENGAQEDHPDRYDPYESWCHFT